jgi:hypothetical protein
MSAAMKRWFGGCLMAASVAVGCGESRLIDDVNDGPTRIAFRPELFRGDVPCRRGSPGALHSYVVNLHQASDVLEPNDAGLPLPPGLTSIPVACDRSVLFTVVAGRFYKALIYGFDRPVTAEEADTVEPRWTSSCGVVDSDQSAPDAGRDPNGPTLAILYQTVPMIGCTPFAVGSNEEPARLVVDQAGALGELRCGSGPGEVSRLEAVLDGNRISAACGSELAFVLQGPAEFHTIELTGFEAVAGPGESDAGALDASAPDPSDAGADAATLPPSGDGGAEAGAGDAGSPGTGLPPSDAGTTTDVPRWRSQCVGQSLPGVTSTATCDPLAPLAAGNL